MSVGRRLFICALTDADAVHRCLPHEKHSILSLDFSAAETASYLILLSAIFLFLIAAWWLLIDWCYINKVLVYLFISRCKKNSLHWLIVHCKIFCCIQWPGAPTPCKPWCKCWKRKMGEEEISPELKWTALRLDLSTLTIPCGTYTY